MRIEKGPIESTLRITALALIAFAVLAASAKAQNIGVFVSSATTDGSIKVSGFATGLDSADAICNRLGTAELVVTNVRASDSRDRNR